MSSKSSSPANSKYGDTTFKLMEVRQGVKEMCFSQLEDYAIFVTTDEIQIVDLVYCEIVQRIRRSSYPRSAKISKCGTFFLASFTDNSVSLFDTKTGSEITKVIGVPTSCSNFLISDNGRRLLYGNNQTVCLWSISTASIQILTNQWRNVNCYAIRGDGNQFALGTYNGSILVLTLKGPQRCSQLQLKRHKSCVMTMVYHKDRIISVSYDKILLITTMMDLGSGEKGVTYTQNMLQNIPRSLGSINEMVLLFYMQGVYWLYGDRIKGFNDGVYSVTKNGKGDTVFVKYDRCNLEWFTL